MTSSTNISIVNRSKLQISVAINNDNNMKKLIILKLIKHYCTINYKYFKKDELRIFINCKK